VGGGGTNWTIEFGVVGVDLFVLEMYHTLVFLAWNKEALAFLFGVDVVGFVWRIAGVQVWG